MAQIGIANGVSDRSARDSINKLAEKGFIEFSNDKGILAIRVNDPDETLRVLHAPPAVPQLNLFSDVAPLPPACNPQIEAHTLRIAQTTGSSAQKSPFTRQPSCDPSCKKPLSPLALTPEVARQATGSSAQNSPSHTSREKTREHVNDSRESREGMNHKKFFREELEPLVWEIWQACGKPGSGRKRAKLGTLWKAAAAYQAGLLSEHELRDACEGTRRCKQPSPNYFFTVLRNAIKRRGADLRQLFAAVWIQPSVPQDAPRKRGSVTAKEVPVQVARSPPAEDVRQRDERLLAELMAQETN